MLGQRFDFASFDHNDMLSTKGATDERGQFVTLQTIANERKTIGMNGSGFIEMLARQMTADLQAIRDSITPGTARTVASKGVLFGTLARRIDGSWDTSGVRGLPAPSLASADSSHPPSLVMMPFHQAGAAVSLRQFADGRIRPSTAIKLPTGRTLWLWREVDIAKGRKLKAQLRPGPKPKPGRR